LFARRNAVREKEGIMSIGMKDNAVIGRIMSIAGLVEPVAAVDAPTTPRRRRVMPASEKRVAANRRNAQRSTGPKSAGGKAIVSGNAVKHGCCSQRPVLPSEDALAFDTFCDEIEAELRPRTTMERVLFPRLVGLLWRLRRLDDAEVHLFAMEADKAPDAGDVPCRVMAERFASDSANGFVLLGRYERGLHAQAMRMLSQYRRLKKDFPIAQYEDDGWKPRLTDADPGDFDAQQPPGSAPDARGAHESSAQETKQTHFDPESPAAGDPREAVIGPTETGAAIVVDTANPDCLALVGDGPAMADGSIAAGKGDHYTPPDGFNPAGPSNMIEKIFKAYDVRATYPNPLNEENAWKVGHAAAQFLKRSRANVPTEAKVKREDTMVVGRDMRPHSPDLANALMDGIRSVGMNVVDVGMVDTSFIYFAINHLDAVGGIMTTASHNPVQYNGFKISGPKAKPIGSATGLDDIKRIASALRVGATGVKGTIVEQDLWKEYRDHVLNFLDLQRPMTVVVDASNGMAGKMVPLVFDKVPNLSIIPMLFEITGTFVHEPNPLVDSNLDMLKAKVKETGADLGGCFDGDADRCFFVDETGQTIGCDILTALMARDFLGEPEHKGATIVYDLRSSKVVPDEIAAAGGVAKRDRVGHAFIKKTMAETKAVFGGELSGHFYFQGNFYADSGAIAFAKVLSVLSKSPATASEQLKPLAKYFQSGEVNFHVEDKQAKIREIAETYKDGKTDYLDGITVDMKDWWFNVRQSNTEPLLRLNLECPSKAMLDEKFKELKKMLGEPVEGH
jgi:phosphomannomutase